MVKLRKLRVALAVADSGTIGGAAQKLNISQPAVSRAIQSLEAEIGTSLFHRSSRRLTFTDSGRVLTNRIARAQDQLRQAEWELRDTGRSREAAAQPLTAQAADHEFSAVIAIAASGTIAAAARNSQISQPALNRSLCTLENRLGVPLFLRTAGGMRTTPAGEKVLRRSKLAFAEIRQGMEEVRQLNGDRGGRLRVGALPLTRVRLVPLAVQRLIERFEAAEIAVVDGAFSSLLGALRNGDIDVLVGTLRQPPPVEDIVSEKLFEDDVAIVTGASHPLARRRSVPLADCLQYGWVLPFGSVPLRIHFEGLLQRAGLAMPDRIVEADSIVVVRSLLVNSDRVAILSRHQVHPEVEWGALKILPVPLEKAVRPVGLTMRRDYAPTPLVTTFLDELRHVAKLIGEEHAVAAA